MIETSTDYIEPLVNFMKKDNIKLSIIIPVYNNVNFTKNALQDLCKLSKDHEIIVVDNNSTDETTNVVNSFVNGDGASIIYIRCSRNLGFGRANNIGFKYSSGKNILFLNNDIRVRENHQGWTQELIGLCEQGYLMSANGGLLDSKFNFIKETNEMHDSEYFYLSGWCLAASRETFDKLILQHYSDDKSDQVIEGKAWGPWNEKFFAYFEDDDLTWRAKDLDIPLKVIKVPVTHFGQMTSRKLDMSTMYRTSQVIFRDLWASRMK